MASNNELKNSPLHFLGIGGIGMSALARIALDGGLKVSGIDRSDTDIVKELRDKGATIHIGDGVHVDPSMTVVYSSAVSKDHPALQAAKAMNCRLFHRSQFLKHLMEGKRSLLVSGTHGKTSTTALLTWVLMSAGLEPSYAVGGILKNTGINGSHGNGSYFVAEADESDGSFTEYTEGYGGIITNIEEDHMNYWKNKETLVKGFTTFASQMKNLYWCIDDPVLSSLKLQGQSYGVSEKADWQLYDVCQENTGLIFSVSHSGHHFKSIKLPMIGSHQALNATSVWGMCIDLGLTEKSLREAFSSFTGVSRRLERKGEVKGILVYDDYAHHPTEVSVTLAALKKRYTGKRLIGIFQPHRYTRTQDCLKEFATSFEATDVIYITEIYSAGEDPISGITGKTLSDVVPGSIFMSSDEDILEGVVKVAKEGDIIITIGAGSITKLGPKILHALTLK
ncbi:PREDICTED: uncharacterized protein LOC105316838 [Amphimedon queenslandica]|uniref:UDP-N-acetylmuramate--L-alanine ligase n=1 Tax=Amphimedon queenslandica TaxID=400682 RepID=A0A1X7VH26_AMPQE|nr:PREDICTED: uncharacterized protein LOC105316838 [Amphimedon queenslandica]|eukprot:XP_011410366.1 PREDICTED: uncharacterized protein LOC105316838 [Amphimedon queenslandica]